jgi:methylmalonyl-CoA mutase N-terminal domain/subunit
LGGAVKAVETGYYGREITKSAYRIQKDIDEKRKLIVGLNCCRMDEKPFDSKAVSEAGERLQLEKLKKWKEDREGEKVEKALSSLKEKARTAENLMPAILEAVKAYATLGEICHTLKEVFGEYKPGVSIF